MYMLGLFKNKIIKNILGLGSFRALGLISNFLLLGLIYRYLSSEELYGLWITISSILSWVFLFDFGVGNGLRNKLTESIHKKNIKLSSKYISTAYIIMLIPTILILVLSFIVTPSIDWISVFNITIPNLTKTYISLFMWLIFSLFAIQFYLTLIFAVLHSIFKSYLISMIQFFINVLNIILISIFYFIEFKSLILLGSIYIGSSILILSVTTIIIFKVSKQNFKLSFKFFDRSLIKPLFNISIQFLVLQFAIIVLFNTDNVLIGKFIGIAEVTPYQLTYKIMSLFTIFLGIVLTPIWTVIIEYKAKQNYKGIMSTIKKVFYLFIFLVLCLIIIGRFVPILIGIWMGTDIIISNQLITCVIIFTIFHMWCNIFQSILNGLSKLRIQVVVYGFASIINIPISILLVLTTNLGVLAIVIGTIISMLIPAIALPYYTFRLFKMV